MIQAKVPGKLCIAGEYVVTEPGYRSILIALGRFATAVIEETDQYKDTIYSKALHHNPVAFSRDENSIVISDPRVAKQLSYVVTAAEIFEQYAESRDIVMKHFHLTIDGNLDDSNGHKCGLGSSAAVLMPVIKVLNEFYDMKLSNLYIYKPVVIASMKL